MKLRPIETKTKKKEPIAQKQIDKQFEGGIEKTIEKNMGEKLKKIKEFEKKAKDRWEFEGDGEFYFSVCFRSKEEKDEFLKKSNIRLREGQFIFADELPNFK